MHSRNHFFQPHTQSLAKLDLNSTILFFNQFETQKSFFVEHYLIQELDLPELNQGIQLLKAQLGLCKEYQALTESFLSQQAPLYQAAKKYLHIEQEEFLAHEAEAKTIIQEYETRSDLNINISKQIHMLSAILECLELAVEEQLLGKEIISAKL